MSERTNISWCDSTVNFWSGCTKVSPGCEHCYAEMLSNRKLGNIGGWGKGALRRFHESAVKLAYKLNREPWVCAGCGSSTSALPGAAYGMKYEVSSCCEASFYRRRIFSLSLGDWLDDEVPIEWLARMLDTIRQCDQVTWILCSKRWENFEKRLEAAAVWLYERNSQNLCTDWIERWGRNKVAPRNIIGLCSVENQETADARIPQFLTVPLACRGLSMEPLLGPVDLTRLCADESMGCAYNALTGFGDWNRDKQAKPIDWMIIGGESGRGARPCNVEWIRSLVAQGRATGVPTFVKQLGAKPNTDHSGSGGGRMLLDDKNGRDPSEWPADLRVQEFPVL